MELTDLIASFRALLLGFAAFAFALLLAMLLPSNSPVFNIALLIEVLALAFVAGGMAGPRPWLHGLLAGLGLCIPGLVAVLSASQPYPDPAAWFSCACVLLFTCAGAQGVMLWRSRRRIAGALMCLGAVILFGLGGDLLRPALSHTSFHAQIDKPLPDLALTTLEGIPIPTAQFQGHITVIDFWGTWCAPCVAELPALSAVHNEYAGNPNVRFLLVNSERNGDTPEMVADFAKSKSISIPIALDPSQSFSKLDTTALPFLLVIDQRGHIRFEDAGFSSGEATQQRLHQEIDVLLTPNANGAPS
jgi:thiol-disulfide isomerase/thioredoxin